MLRSVKNRIRKIERLLPGPITVRLVDGSTRTLPAHAGIGLLQGVISEARTGITPRLVAEYGDVIDRLAPEQGDGDGTLVSLIRVLRAGIRDLREQPDEHQLLPMEELQ